MEYPPCWTLSTLLLVVQGGRMASLPAPQDTPTLTVEQAAEALGISRGSAYEAVNRGEIPSLRIGRRLVIPTAALWRMLGLDAVAS